MKLVQETLEVNDSEYALNIYYEGRRNTRASITQNSINIRIPSFLSAKDREKVLVELKEWVIKRLKESPEKFSKKSLKEYKMGDNLKVGNDEYLLNIEYEERKSSRVMILEDKIYLKISSELPKSEQQKHISNLISKAVASKKFSKIKEKVHLLNAKHFNREVRNVLLKHNQSNWGSCSKQGNINLSTRLLFAPEDVIDYVCIHELAHLIEMNHSKNFWELVKKAMPDYKEKQKWLKNHGEKCRF